ncbi:flagellar assembly protein FliW [Geobacter pickeringii]|uniref:flagellar assembly protein FliW n=1 Tax=Geobacter pickeringii TaxID=345632 RepID=UPI000A037664|nr:flagellar assembly protein FliW [Geobacter pickeringii]
MKISTARFGALDIDENKVIAMPEGMLGFDEKRFVLLTPPNLGPFCWLQAVDNPDLAFVVVDTKNCIPDYTLRLTAEEFEKLQLAENGEAIFLAIVTMSSDPFAITVNLQGPIVLNPERMIAKQIVLEGGKYSTKYPFFRPDGAAATPAKQESCANTVPQVAGTL